VNINCGGEMEKSDRQKQIVEVAVKLIAEHGIQYLTIKHIAAEIGVSEPALYRHFDSKLDILKAMIDSFQLLMQPAFEKQKTKKNSLDKIEAFMLEHFRIFNLNNDFAKVIFSESNFRNEEVLMTSLNKMMNNSRRMLEDIIISGQRKNDIRSDVSSISLSRLLIGSMRFLVTQWSLSGMIFDLENEARQLCEDIKKLIVAK